MLYKVGDVFDFEAGVKFSELLVYELSTIVGFDGVRHAITAYNIFPDELLDRLYCDSGKWFSFYPFGKVVDTYFAKGHGESMERSCSCF